jgi:hypothetical protein
MESQDKLETILNAFLEETRTTMENHYTIVTLKLDSIKEDTTKTNGRVNKLEDEVKRLAIEDQKHMVSCPIAIEVRELKNTVSEMRNRKRFIFSTITLNTIILGIIGTIVAIFLNLKGK